MKVKGASLTKIQKHPRKLFCNKFQAALGKKTALLGHGHGLECHISGFINKIKARKIVR